MGGEQRQHVVGVARPRLAGVEHERLARQALQAQRLAEQRVPGGQGGDQRLFAEHALADRRVVDADASETDVDTPALQRLDLLQGGHLQQAQLQLRVAAQVADQLRQHAIQRRGHEADAEPLALALADPPGAVADAFQLVQERRALFVEEAPGFGQAQRPAALQQGHPEHFLELLDLPAQRWLGDVQLLGGAGEVEGPGQRLEVAQVTKLHDTSRVWFERKMILDPSEEGDGCLAETTAKPARYRASLEQRTVENPTATLVDPRE